MTYRWAEPSDEIDVAHLLVTSAGEMGSAVLGMGSPERALTACAKFFASPGCLHARETALVACVDQRVTGLVTFTALGQIRNRNVATIWPLLRALGPILAIRSILRGRLPTALGPRPIIPRFLRRRNEAPMVPDASVGDYYIAALAVDARHRRQGIGSCLLDLATTAAIDRGARVLAVNVFAENTAAIDLYAQKGFAPIRRIEPDLGGVATTIDSILSLQKRLP